LRYVQATTKKEENGKKISCLLPHLMSSPNGTTEVYMQCWLHVRFIRQPRPIAASVNFVNENENEKKIQKHERKATMMRDLRNLTPNTFNIWNTLGGLLPHTRSSRICQKHF